MTKSTTKRSQRMEVNIHEAKTHLSRLLERVAMGEDFITAQAGTPVAKLVPIKQTNRCIIATPSIAC